MPPESSTATVILCAGRMSYVAVPIAVGSTNAMLPVNGKPVIAWTLDRLLKRGIRDATIVVRADDDDLPTFARYVYGSRMTLRIARAPSENGSIVRSLLAGLDAHPEATSVRVLLGDTIIDDPLDARPSFVYVADVQHPDRWCVAETGPDGRIARLHDKRHLPGRHHDALVGYYRFGDAAALRSALIDAIETQERELSAVLLRYGGHDAPLQVVRADVWYDFGNIDNLAQARLSLLQPREFNSVRIDHQVHAITKRSADRTKMRNEANWFASLPPSLALLAPRLTASGEDAETGWYTLEFYGYPTLAELFVCGRMLPDVWDSILRRVLDVHALIASHPGTLPAGTARTMYGTKTEERLQQLAAQRPDWTWLGATSLTLNGRTIGGPATVMQRLAPWIDRLEATMQPTICHGDYCFSNVLYDIGSQIVRVIDPRGSFGVPGLYGDPRYDLAKLRHSVCGGYDFIVAGYVEAHDLGDGRFELDWKIPETARRAAEFFDDHIEARGLPAAEIRLIEALLFLTMAPLHADVPSRQLIMLLHGLDLLDKAT